MKKGKRQFKILSLALSFLVLGFLLLTSPRATAQVLEPFIFLTWRADSYAPADFRGKVLPTAYTKISAGVEVISNGKTADLARATVNWYLNDNLIAAGPGLRQITFNAPEFENTVYDLRAEILGVGDDFLVKTVEIPVVRPEVVIEAPFPDKKFSSGQIVLAAKPYFWNSVADLIYNWKVNGQETADASGVLRVNLNSGVAPGYGVRAEVAAHDPTYLLESKAKSVVLTFEQ
jgi:hypothetical protein